MLNLEKINENYERYKQTVDGYKRLGKKLEQLKKDNDMDNLLDRLGKLRDSIKANPQEKVQRHYFSLIDELLSSNKELKEYTMWESVWNNTKDKIYDLRTAIVTDEYQRYIALKHDLDDNYDLVELYTQEIVDLSDFDEDKKEYIIELLKNAGSFIGYATRDDLPLLMNILEEYDIPFNYDDVDEFNWDEEEYLFNESRSFELGLELVRAHMFDENIDERIYTNYDGRKETISNHINITFDIDEEFRNLPYHKKDMTKELLEKYYLLLTLKHRNIEELYLLANEEEKEVILDMYSHYSEKDNLFRTSSPIINQEMLKRKMLKK